MKYGNVFRSLQEAVIVLELEELDRSAWGQEPSNRTIRQCPNCMVWHDGEDYCTKECEDVVL